MKNKEYYQNKIKVLNSSKFSLIILSFVFIILVIAFSNNIDFHSNEMFSEYEGYAILLILPLASGLYLFEIFAKIWYCLMLIISFIAFELSIYSCLKKYYEGCFKVLNLFDNEPSLDNSKKDYLTKNLKNMMIVNKINIMVNIIAIFTIIAVNNYSSHPVFTTLYLILIIIVVSIICYVRCNSYYKKNNKIILATKKEEIIEEIIEENSNPNLVNGVLKDDYKIVSEYNKKINQCELIIGASIIGSIILFILSCVIFFKKSFGLTICVSLFFLLPFAIIVLSRYLGEKKKEYRNKIKEYRDKAKNETNNH